MSRKQIHSKTKNICIVCEEQLKDENRVFLHKTRRQTHSMCHCCCEGYMSNILNEINDRMRLGLDTKTIFKCPGTINGEFRNQCKHEINFNHQTFKNIKNEKLQLIITRILFFKENQNICRICINKECGNIVQYTQNNQCNCSECSITWCSKCLCSPYHDGITCIEHLIIQGDSKDGQYMGKLLKDGTLKLCPACKIPTIKNDGCNKMTCVRCQTKWCWLCSKTDVDYGEHYNLGGCSGKLWEGATID